MTPEDSSKIRVSARIPKDLYDTCLQRYDNITNAINIGLELLCNKSEDVSRQNEDECPTGEDGSIKHDIHELRVRFEEKDKQIEEKDRHIETLKKDLNVSQEMHRNYMLQVQTLISQKAIEAPGAKKPWYKFW